MNRSKLEDDKAMARRMAYEGLNGSTLCLHAGDATIASVYPFHIRC